MGNALLIAALALAAAYGLVFTRHPASLLRTTVKTGSMVCLALWAHVSGAPGLIVLALGFSALGDTFLAGDPKRWLLAGMAAFAAAHLVYVAQFVQLAGSLAAVEDWRPPIGAILAGLGVLWLMRRQIEGPMQNAVLIYGLVILSMLGAALILPIAYIWAVIGALAFVASDTILSLELFVMEPDDPRRRFTSRLVWSLYFGGQAMIAMAFIN